MPAAAVAPSDGDLEYQPAPDSPSALRDGDESDSSGGDASDDPLEAFMAGIEVSGNTRGRISSSNLSFKLWHRCEC